MNNDTGSSTWSPRTLVLLALPFVVVLLSAMVWVTAVSRSGFWADDFLNLTHYARSLGDLSNDHLNTGHYIINVFWAVGTLAFGSGSVVPFLLLNTLVFAAGLVIWLRTGTRTRWGSVEAWWIGGLFIATTAWLPTTLWSSNITHSGGFLALGAGLFAHERCMSARTARSAVLWSLASGAAWTLAVVSNILYIGLLAFAGYCAVHQVLKIRRFRLSTLAASAAVGSWNLLIPVVFFATVAYPGTTANPVYATNGLRFVHQNLRYYRETLAPTSALTTVYIAMLLMGIVGAVAAVRRRDWFPIAVLGAAGVTTLPALVQSQQHDIHYMAMPLLLTFSALVAGARPILLGHTRQLVRLKRALFLAALATLVLIFRQGANLRSYFVQTPYGDALGLAAFRSELASLTPENSTICAKLDLDAAHQAFLIAAMSGEDGFLVPPISAGRAYLVSPGQTCPAHGSAADITVSLDARGDFVAAR